MGKPRFPMPDGIETIVVLLNASQLWNMTVVAEGETYVAYDGDQPMFDASTELELRDFLAGCFLMTFNGASLDQIRGNIASGRGQFGLSTAELPEPEDEQHESLGG